MLLSSPARTSESEETIVRERPPLAVRTEAQITYLGERARYLDVEVQTGGYHYRFFLPNSDECRAIAGAEEDVGYVQIGTMGKLKHGDLNCFPVGVLSLRAWRDQRPRNLNRSLVPRARATYEIFYRDADLALARGRFPLTTQIGFAGGVDSVAVIPVEEACESTLERQVGTLEFRARGPVPFALVDRGGLCPLLGFAQSPELPGQDAVGATD